MEKTCTQCGISKDLSEFSKAKYAKSGYRSECKVCARPINAAWGKENRDKVREAARRYRAKYFEKHGKRANSGKSGKGGKSGQYIPAHMKTPEALERQRERCRAYQRKEKREMSDRYIAVQYLMPRIEVNGKRRLIYIPLSQIPKELIDLKRQQILLGRLIKEKR